MSTRSLLLGLAALIPALAVANGTPTPSSPPAVPVTIVNPATRPAYVALATSAPVPVTVTGAITHAPESLYVGFATVGIPSGAALVPIATPTAPAGPLVIDSVYASCTVLHGNPVPRVTLIAMSPVPGGGGYQSPFILPLQRGASGEGFDSWSMAPAPSKILHDPAAGQLTAMVDDGTPGGSCFFYVSGHYL